MSAPFRIVVTGSRDWTDVVAITDALVRAMSLSGAQSFVIVQGYAQGADHIAKQWAAERSIPCETFEPFWASQGKSAGPKRNRRMLDAGADLVLAFPIGGRKRSPGTWDCIEAASERGIPVRIFGRRP